MEEIFKVLITLLAAIAAFPMAAKARAEYRKAELEYQIAMIELAKVSSKNNTDKNTSNNRDLTSNSARYSRDIGLFAVLLSTGYLAFLTFAVDSAPVTVGHVSSIAQSLILCLSGAYLMVRR